MSLSEMLRRPVTSRRRLGMAVAFLGLSFGAWAQTLGISSGGTPSYVKQIDVPPGIAGMAPNMALLYSGSDVNGPLGHGWTLQGISTITRCPSSKVTDGAARAVNYGVDDKLCLDGQRLIQTDANGVVLNGSAGVDPDHPLQTSDSAGGDGLVHEYRTEKDIYARIRAYGKAGGDVANGPLYFRVWTKAGQMYEYGGAGDVRANAAIAANGKVVAWAVSRISDSIGNYMDFQYEQRDVAWGTALATDARTPTSGHEWNLLEIRYTGHGSDHLPTNKVVFEYSDRADTPGTAQDRGEAYHMGQKNVSVRRLDAISTYINWPAGADSRPATAIKVRTVKLAYEQGVRSGRSRLKSITECSGADGNVCLAPVSFNYADGGGVTYVANGAFAGGQLATLPLQSANNDVGALSGNFFGTGRTDILRWADNPAQNQLYRNDGDGNFTLMPNGSGGGAFNIDQNLFKRNGCFSATALDFNGDGATDILRTMKSNSNGVDCGPVRNVLYLSKGDGSFTAVPIEGIDLSQVTAGQSSVLRCDEESLAVAPASVVRSGARAPSAAPPGTNSRVCPGGNTVYYSQTRGATFHLLDVNNDGLIDIITTIAPEYRQLTPRPTSDELCADKVCTRVYLGQGNGSFVEKTNTNLATHSLYATPTANAKNFFQRAFIGDINGDGMADLVVDSGTWYARGDGNFDRGGRWDSTACEHMLDLNGDGRSDCLFASAGNWPASQAALVADGTGKLRPTRNFNLNVSGFELGGYLPNSEVVNMGFITADFDGDGRGDILRWSDNPAQNALYLSNGDGTFRIGDFNLTQPDKQLQKSDGSFNFLLGDFTGHGQIELLRLVSTPSGSDHNVLFEKADATPPDQLVSAVSSGGLRTTLHWASI